MVYLAIWKRKTIIQLQVDDYWGINSAVIFFDMIYSPHRRYYNLIFGNIGIRKRKAAKIFQLRPQNQTILDQFLPGASNPAPKSFKRPYKTRVILPPVPPAFMASVDYAALQSYSANSGYLDHLFQFNSMTFWEELQVHSPQAAFYTQISMADVFRLEMARYKLGIRTYEHFMRELAHNFALLMAVQLDPERIPNPSQYGQLVAHLGSYNIHTYFRQLVQECIQYKLIDCKVVIWDGRFLRSYCANNKNKRLNAFADQEAGLYKHIGKFYGVGYLDSTIVCAKYHLPVYYESYPANRNDNPIFRATFQHFMDLAPPAPRILLTDAGPYSKKSLKLVRSYQIVPLIFARKNCKDSILKVAERKYIQIKYVPPEMVPHLATLLNLRPDIEKQFSPAKVCYHADRMTNRGRENAAINIGKLKCIELLTALTAVKVHRLDLINCPTAFRAYHPKYSTRTLLNNMSDDRVALFNPLKSESLFV